MTENKEISPAEKDGKYEFQLFYAEREVTCRVEKEQNILHICIDENINADLRLNDDGSISQTSGAKLPQSSIDFIKKHVLGHEV